MSGDCIVGGLVVVVGHQVDGIDILLHLAHLGVGEKVGRGAGRDRDVEPPVKLLFLLVEALAKLLEEQRVVLLVLGAEMISGADLAWVLPVDVESVEIVAVDELDDAVDEESCGSFW